MRIDKLHIENFGKLSNLDLHFDKGYNQIKKENGWGKTTLTIFIKAMFYGMPAARDNLKMERKKYYPWQGGIYGGSIDYSTENGNFRLIRQFGKTPEGDTVSLIDLNSNKELEMPKIEIGEYLFGVGKDTFEMTAFLPQLKFTSSGSDKISASVLGLEKFKYDLANLSQAIENIKKKISLLKKVKPKQIELDIIKREIDSNKVELNGLQKRISAVKDERQGKEKLLEELNLKDAENDKILRKQNQQIEEKKKLENELIKKSEELNSLLLKLEEFRNIPTEKIKEKKIWPFVLGVAIPCVVLVVLLFSLHIINMLLSSILFVSIIILSLVVYYVLSAKLNKVDPEKLKESEELENNKKSIEKNVETLQKEINDIKNKLSQLIEIEVLDNDFDNIREEIYNVKIIIERLYSEENMLLRDKDSFIEKIENGNDELLQKQEVLKTIDEKIDLLNSTQEFLLKANENVSSRFVKPINDAFSNLLSHINVNGRKFIVDNSFAIKEETEMGLKEFDYSSQGYQDILSFCMRMYLVKEVFKQEKPFVVLDDIFVNLDDENLDKIKKVLSEFSQEFQIFYICCNSRCSIK